MIELRVDKRAKQVKPEVIEPTTDNGYGPFKYGLR